MTSVYRRRAALRDIDAATKFYLAESDSVAIGFIDAVEAATDLLRDYPDAGSLRIGQESGIAELRSLRTKGYPYLVFYWVVEDDVEILRVLHASRDLPTILSQMKD